MTKGCPILFATNCIILYNCCNDMVVSQEQMVSDYSSVTDNLMTISRQLAETVERSKMTVDSLEDTSKTVDEVGYL